MRSSKTQLSMGSRVRNAALSAICSMTLAAGLVPALAIAEQPNFEFSDLSAMAYDEASDYSVIWTYAADYDYQHVAPGSQFTVELAASTTGAALSCCQVEIAYDTTKVSLGTDSIVMSKALEEAEAYDRGDGTAIITFYGNTMNAVNMASLTFTAAAEAAGDPAIVITNVICGASGDLNDANVNYTQGNAAVAIGEPGYSHDSEGYVKRLYAKMLGDENPAESKVSYWVGQIEAGSDPAEVVRSFAASDAFKDAGYTNEQIIRILYDAVLGNENPDQISQVDYWVAYMEQGYTVAELIDGFAASEAFKQICADYNMTWVAPPIHYEHSARGFVERLYAIILLNNAPAENEILYWCDLLENYGYDPAEVVRGFIKSDTYAQAGYTNAQKVNLMYAALLDEVPDAAKLSYWVANLESGYTDIELVNGFADSVAFQNVCANYGLTWTKPPRVFDHTPEGFVLRCYSKILNNDEPSNPAYWTNQIPTIGAKGVVLGFVNSTAWTSANHSNEQKVRIMYAAMLGNDDPAVDKVSYWLNLMNNGMTDQGLVEGFAGSDAFKALCASYGM